MHQSIAVLLLLAAVCGTAAAAPTGTATALSTAHSGPLPSPRANTSPRQSDIDRDLPLRPSAFLSSPSASLATAFIDDRNESSATRGTWSLVLVSASANGTMAAASLDLTLPWTIAKKAGEAEAWIPPTTLRANPLNATEVREELGTAFRGVNVSIAGLGGAPASAAHGRKVTMVLSGGQGQVAGVDAVGKNEFKLDATAVAGNATMDWAAASTSSIVGQYGVSGAWSSTYALDKNGDLYEVDSTGAIRPDPIRITSTTSPSKRTNASLVHLSPHHLLLTGGFNGTHALDDIWIFEHSRSIWTPLANVRLSTPRRSHQVAVAVMEEHNGKSPITALVFPGKDDADLVNGMMAVDVLEVFPTANDMAPFPPCTMQVPVQLPPPTDTSAGTNTKLPAAPFPVVIQDPNRLGAVTYHTYLMLYFPPPTGSTSSAGPLPIQLYRVPSELSQSKSHFELVRFLPQSYFWPTGLYRLGGGVFTDPRLEEDIQRDQEAMDKQARDLNVLIWSFLGVTMALLLWVVWCCIKCCQVAHRANEADKAKWNRAKSRQDGDAPAEEAVGFKAEQ